MTANRREPTAPMVKVCAPVASFWPEGGIVCDLDMYGDNLFVGGAEHFWETRDSLSGESLKYQQVTNDTQNVEVIGDRVYAGCHCDGRRHRSLGGHLVLRYPFQVDDATVFSELLVGLLRDDGAAVYLNGTELMRDNLPAGPVDADTLASDYAWGVAQWTDHEFVLPRTLLQTGVNLLAVEIHSADQGSAELSCGFSLAAR